MQMLMQASQEGKLLIGAIANIALHFGVSTRSVSRIWNATRKCIANGTVLDTSLKLVSRVGRKRVQIQLEGIQAIPLCRRTNIRSLASALQMSKSTIHRRIKEGNLRPHSNAVKPYLTDDNKKARVNFCLSMINKGMNEAPNLCLDMFDHIHIDEKWFYMSKTTQKFYLHPHEMEPLRTCKSKRFILKIIFLAAVARPQFDIDSNQEFNGKFGIWPFVFKEPAKRSSKNRVAGTMETKPISSVTKDVIRSCLIQNLLPVIQESWPSRRNNTIFIQQDNARPHIEGNDVEFFEVVRRSGLDIQLCSQAPNSPDLNVLDLGFFRAINFLQHQEAPNTVDDFVSSVQKAFHMFPTEDLNNVFLTLQSCMLEILKTRGEISYKVPHMNKKRLLREGTLPTCLECDGNVLGEAEEFVHLS